MQLVTTQELAKLLRTTPRTIRRWVDDGLIPEPAVRIGRTIRFDQDEVMEAVSGGSGKQGKGESGGEGDSQAAE